ncbi:GGDEF domain-containing protein [Shinella sp.]|jgi:diguanylate cyclase (GGDEF)-like protein|uniref:GGDEF domain-containing protein n=1 Tax=Shinella sp. TaxID=1870904 RepID=UPI0029B67A3C|nr:GGDEF domain-containing protein [Shinella sp.]MDX3974371.1 GGDEF domain-containing protein [Shinella sp.]
MSMPEAAKTNALSPHDGAAGDQARARSRQEVDFWMDCVGAPLVLMEKQALTVRYANRNAAILFGLGLEPFGACPIDELVGPEAALMLGQIWSVAPVGVPGEPFLIRALVQGQERTLMVQVTKLAVEDEILRLFSFVDAPPQGSVTLAGWQENVISLLNWLPFGFEIASSEDQIQFANSTFKELFGYTMDDIANIEDWWRLAYPDPEYREFARTQWHTSIAAARAEDREMTPFDLDVMTASGARRTIQFRHRTIGNFNVNLYIDVTRERAYAEELKVLADTDPLTGAMNRRRFFEEADRIHADSKRRDAPIAFLMLDIDHFKSINDRYGHGVGDLVLIEFTRRCREVLHPGDCFGRMGGEEFAVVLGAGTRETVYMVAERIRSAIGTDLFAVGLEPFNVSVSAGGAICETGESVGSVISRADNALYDAKKSGRDRVIIR